MSLIQLWSQIALGLVSEFTFRYLQKYKGCFLLDRDKRDRVNAKDFIVDNVSGQTICRIPESVKGQQFIIQNCQVRKEIIHCLQRFTVKRS